MSCNQSPLPTTTKIFHAMRSACRTLLLLSFACVASTASAQEWATKMFASTSHNFGTVAKGSKTEYHFTFRNIYKEPIHIVGVRTSCGCTSPEISKNDLKTHETAEVVAKFNTRTFLGQHGATLTVTIDKPYYAEVQLRVAGNIRGDVSFDPPFVDMGSVDVGAGAERTIRVIHSGSGSWEIKDVRSANTNFEVSLSSITKTSNESSYNLTVKLKPGAPAGYLKNQLILVTSDPRATQIPIDIEGRVVAEVSVSPQLLAMGSVLIGESVTKNIVIRANKPFRVTGVVCSDPAFSCQMTDKSATVQILAVTFKADGNVEKRERQFQIKTDLGEGVVPSVTVQATVEAPAVEASFPPSESDNAEDQKQDAPDAVRVSSDTKSLGDSPQ